MLLDYVQPSSKDDFPKMELWIELLFDGISAVINSIFPQIPVVNSEHKDQSR